MIMITTCFLQNLYIKKQTASQVGIDLKAENYFDQTTVRKKTIKLYWVLEQGSQTQVAAENVSWAACLRPLY